MNAYRQQQLRAAALIEQGANAEQVAAVYGWTARAAPERSGTTGHNQTLTPRRKCGIIKAIKRHVRRKIKNYRRTKTMMTFTQMLAELERGNMDYTTCRVEDAAQWTLADGSTIKTYSLGRDGGFDIIGRDASGAAVCYICTDSGYEQTGADLDAIAGAIKDGAKTLEQVFDMWENGFGGSPFDMEYLPQDYK